MLVMFKSAEDAHEDPFLQAVQSRFPSIRASIISPHEFRPCLRQLPDAGDYFDCNVLIFTSKRAVQFYSDLCQQSRPFGAQQSLICYAVGPATADAATAAGFLDVRGGAKCGCAAALCDLVTAELQPLTHKLLFPCGRVRKDTIETRLSQDRNGAFQLTILELYEAAEKDSLANELDTFLKSTELLEIRERRLPLMLAFFSPSSASMVLSHFNGFDCDLKFISIGPSTSERLKALRGDIESVECCSPTIEAFLTALSQYLVVMSPLT